MRKYLLSGITAAVLAGSAFANPAQSSGGAGNLLIAPGFFTDSGFSTKVQLVNTDNTRSVVMRGAVRDQVSSAEVDFVVLLSPNDVWTATLKTDANGKPVLVSSDESNYAFYANPALGYKKVAFDPTGVNPLTIDLRAANTVASSANANAFSRGYVEFWPIATFNEAGKNTRLISSDFTKGTKRLGAFKAHETVDKQAIAQRYEALAFPCKAGVPDTAANFTPGCGLGLIDSTLPGGSITFDPTTGIAAAGVNAGGVATNVDYNIIGTLDADTAQVDAVVVGEVTVSNATLNASMTLPMTAIVVDADDNREGVIRSNAASFKPGASATPETVLGGIRGTSATASAAVVPGATTTTVGGVQYNTYTAAIQALLSEQEVAALYDNFGANNQLWFTFWAQYTGGQNRYFDFRIKNTNECDCCKPMPTPATATTCPYCPPAVSAPVDPVSGAKVQTLPYPCTLSLANEFNGVGVDALFGLTPSVSKKCDDNIAGADFSSGWVKLRPNFGATITDVTGQNLVVSPIANTFVANPAALVTQMKAVQFGSQWSFNWLYPNNK